jgi:murein DD-endopeptidase MepM/ murein hydrolase activator NlpD
MVTAVWSEFSIVTQSDNQVPAHRQSARRLAIRRRAQRSHFRFYTRCVNWSFLRNVASAPISWRREHWVLGGVVALLTLIAGIVLPTWANAMRHEPAPSLMAILELPLPGLPIADAERSEVSDDASSVGTEWRVVKVRAGQSVADIFRQQGLSPGDLQRLLDNPADASALRHIHPGDEFAFDIDATGQLRALRFDRDDHTRVIAHLGVTGIRQDVQDREIERRVQVSHGVVTRSLFDAGEQAGMSDAMILKLANAFGYDIDFAQDLREGDSFTAIYDDVYREGERLREGEIIAATFINQGKRFAAIRYTDADGNTMFYSEDGRPLRKAFLRTPVEFSRITSGFSLGRMHPILGIMRAHRGVDYGAPPGTAIHAAGDGKLMFRGWQNGYGNVVILQHGGRYSTLYGHMSRFADRLNVGQRVSQGQTIGFVGMTGLATAPHLHYEFRVDGNHRDPLTVTLPKAEPLAPTELARFRGKTQPLLAKLRLLEATRLAAK